MKTLLSLALLTALPLSVSAAPIWFIGTTNANSVTQETAWQTAVGGAPVEMFDTMTVGAPLGFISSVGLTVRTYTDTTQALVASGGGTFTRSPDQFLWNTSHQQTFFDTSTPLSGFAYWAAGGDGDIHRVTLFDASNNVIGTNLVTAELSAPCFFGVTSTVGIVTIMVEAAGGGGTQDSLGFDNLQVHPGPEPCSVLALGLGAVGLLRRRKGVAKGNL